MRPGVFDEVWPLAREEGSRAAPSALFTTWPEWSTTWGLPRRTHPGPPRPLARPGAPTPALPGRWRPGGWPGRPGRPYPESSRGARRGGRSEVLRKGGEIMIFDVSKCVRKLRLQTHVAPSGCICKFMFACLLTEARDRGGLRVQL